MSQPHQIAIVPVSTSLTETVHLSDVMGRVPVAEIRELLNSQWAIEREWRVVRDGVMYQREISQDVTLQMEISDQGQVTFHRQTQTQTVESNLAAQARDRQSRRLSETEDRYNFAINELVGQATLVSLSTYARENGYKITQEVVNQGVIQEIVVEVLIHQ